VAVATGETAFSGLIDSISRHSVCAGVMTWVWPESSTIWVAAGAVPNGAKSVNMAKANK